MNGYEQEIIVLPQHVEVIFAAAEHEAGHIIAAHHLGARVLGIALGFIPARSQKGMFLQAIYGWGKPSTEVECIVKAAGPAADILYHGECTEIAASGDLHDIEILTGKSSFEPYLEKAKIILRQHGTEFQSIVDALQTSLDSPEQRTLERLPNESIGTLLVDEAQLLGHLRC